MHPPEQAECQFSNDFLEENSAVRDPLGHGDRFFPIEMLAVKASIIGWANSALLVGFLVLFRLLKWIVLVFWLPLNVLLINGLVIWKRSALNGRSSTNLDQVALRRLRQNILFLTIPTTLDIAVALWAWTAPLWGLFAPFLLVFIWLNLGRVVSKSSVTAVDGPVEGTSN